MSPILPQLWRLLSRWRGYSYGALDHAAKEVDCSAFAASILRDHYGAEVVTPDRWRDLNLSTEEHAARPWAPVETMAEALGSPPVYPFTGPNTPGPAGKVLLCQGWAHLTTEGIGPGSKGHQFMCISMGGWDVVVIESNHPNGPQVVDLDPEGDPGVDGRGSPRVRPLGDVVNAGGDLVAPLHPMDWKHAASRFTSGVAWVALP